MDLTLVSAYDPAPPPHDHGDRYVGGVERMLLEVSERMAGRGHDVTILCSSSRAYPSTMRGSVRISRVRRSATIMRAPIAGLASHVPAQTDLVHVAATYPFTTAPVLRRAHRLGVPSILDYHFEPGPGSVVGKLAAGLYRRVIPPDYALARLVVVRSRGYGRSAPGLSAIPEERWRIVPNGIDPARFHPDGPVRLDDYILFVGRLVPYKGLPVLLQALARARIHVPLHIVGDGPLRRSLEAQARRLGLDVQFLGRVPDNELPALYRGARFTVLPSVTGQEAFGIALIESMACGTPVVASRLPGVEEVARSGGIVAEPGDPDSLGAAMRVALEPGLPRGRDLAARTHARFSWDAVTDQLLGVYEEAIQGRPAEPPRPLLRVAR